MSIFFSCECGNQLKAREKMAGRLSFCPRCGTSVRIPALEPTHSGLENKPENLPSEEGVRLERKPTTEKLVSHGSPRVIRRLIHQDDSAQDDSAQDSGRNSRTNYITEDDTPSEQSDDTKKKKRKRKKKRIKFEGWAKRLIFPFHEYRILLGLSGYFTITASLFLMLFPDTQQSNTDKISLSPIVWGGALPFLLIGMAYCGALFNRVLFFTIIKYRDEKSVPKLTLSSAIDSFLFWLVAFVAGPCGFFLLLILYWVYCGDLDVWDFVILGELLCGGLTWWILTVLGNSHRLQKMPWNPMITFRALKLFGWNAILSALAICPIFAGATILGIYAVAKLTQNAFLGVTLLFSVAFLFLYTMQIALRTIGISYYKTKTKAEMELQVS